MVRYALAVVLTMFLTSNVLVGGVTAHAAPVAEPAVARPASTFTSLSPERVLDTRTGAGGVSGPVGGGRTVVLPPGNCSNDTQVVAVTSSSGLFHALHFGTEFGALYHAVRYPDGTWT